MQNTNDYINDNTIEINTGGFPKSTENGNAEGSSSKRKNNNELVYHRKNKVVTSMEELFNKKQKICDEIKDVINPSFKIDNMLYKKTKTLKELIKESKRFRRDHNLKFKELIDKKDVIHIKKANDYIQTKIKGIDPQNVSDNKALVYNKNWVKGKSHIKSINSLRTDRDFKKQLIDFLMYYNN
ncbi:hypothetical protein PIROE2DRAFT_14171 [Piromyces sp. E2]|nr:hypothetical protein PIROE2DRAFT_14171 [Piromyces sp. E2]|eukprot:OUM60141.1 hypothetical protein PIROE2DRAFT_14171 [Piromyces sp. E2]